MKKYGILLVNLFLLQCKSAEKISPSCYQGKLVLQGICMNDVIEAVNKDIDTSQVAVNWKNPTTGKSYQHVFALASTCTFPPNIKEGDSFTFKIVNPPKENTCAQCLAYSPTPSKKLYIEICP
ncbi:hypothetical protein [Aquirufa ecclesiirivi]|uniref:hypothetical protein n=1 Tax=Aquirufa ecclesiirivi TaxID=2715124 RepID=UPI001408BA1E|nr:hypothetical protein [Aquirufa ecclesiirivi]NHC48109.1 hypothetical protein [Aquirufa ecclesiirivi]